MNMAIQMFARLEEAPGVPIQWESDHTAFMIRCVMMACEWRGNVPSGDPIERNFGDFELRCPVAVNMTIGSTRVHDEAKLVVAWINHRNENCCAALRAAIVFDRCLSTEGGKRLLSCLIDFIVQPAWLTYAMSPRPEPAIDRELVAEPSRSASGVAGCL